VLHGVRRVLLQLRRRLHGGALRAQVRGRGDGAVVAAGGGHPPLRHGRGASAARGRRPGHLRVAPPEEEEEGADGDRRRRRR